MSAILSPPRSLLWRQGLQSYGPVAVGAVLAALLCWTLARWSWVLWEGLMGVPTPPAASGGLTAPSTAELASASIMLHPFGQVAAEPAAPPPPTVQASPLNAPLKGIFTASGPFPAVAIFNVDGRDLAVPAGGELTPGVRLLRVLAEPGRDFYVEVQRNGVTERIDLDAGAAAARPGRGMTGPGTGVPPPAQAAKRAGGSFKLAVQSTGPNSAAFSRAELNQSLQDPKQLSSLGRATVNPAGGLNLEEVPAGSLAERLGLQQGDVLRAVNGQPINTITDLPRLYQEFGQSAQVQLDLVRGGRPTQMTFNIRP